MSARNDQLRNARRRLESPTRPGMCLSREELAAAVNHQVYEACGTVVAVDSNYIGKLERRVISWPNDLYRRALQAILGVSNDADLGFIPPRRVLRVEAMDSGRRDFVRAAALGLGAAVTAPAGLLDTVTPTPVPSRIGRAEIDQVIEAASTFASWDNSFGGALARESSLAQLRYSAGLLKESSCPSAQRGELFSAVGYLAHSCGFMAFDDHAYQDARRIYGFGLSAAEEGDDWHLRARILGSMARLEIWIGRPDDGLTLTQQALVRSDRLTASEQAMLHSLQARALARMERVGETLRTIGTADGYFTARSPEDDPPWMRHYNAAQHAGDTGVVLLDLAADGRVSPHDTATRLRTAVDERPVEFVRSRALSQVHLAKLAMTTGDPAEAVALGNEALDTAGTVRSRRVAEYLRDLASSAERHRGRDDVGSLRERIATAAAA